MPVYVWAGRTRQGNTKKGVLEAVSEAAATAQLRAQGILPNKLKPKARDVEDLLPFLQPRIKTQDLVVFTRQFAVMIDAGLPLVQCLQLLGDQMENKTFKNVCRDIRTQVEQGSTFAESLARHPKVFSALFVNLVAAGEVGGILDTILNRLAAYLEKAEKLARQVRGAMTYPVTVLLIAVGVISVLMVKVIPVFEKMFADFGGALPGPTQAVVDLSAWMQSYLVYCLVAAGLCVFGFFQARERSEGFRFQTDRVLLASPIFGPLLKKVAVARFTRTLGTMIASGVPILEALDIVGRSAGNLVIEEEIQTARSAIAEGRTIAEPLQESKVFPGMVVQMIAVGEETGSMETMLSKIADFYDDEVDTAVASLTAMLEPLMILFLGGAVGGILIAMYMPIFKIAENIM
jgi:type IV pilus assembly protein PilC